MAVLTPTSIKAYKRGNGLRSRIFGVTSDDASTWQSGIRGIIDVWWIGGDNTQIATVTVSNITNGTIRFDTSGTVGGQILIRSKG